MRWSISRERQLQRGLPIPSMAMLTASGSHTNTHTLTHKHCDTREVRCLNRQGCLPIASASTPRKGQTSMAPASSAHLSASTTWGKCALKSSEPPSCTASASTSTAPAGLTSGQRPHGLAHNGLEGRASRVCMELPGMQQVVLQPKARQATMREWCADPRDTCA